MWHNFIYPVMGYFRQKRGRFLQAVFPDIAKWRICDLGGSRHFWEKVAIEGLHFSNITIYNISKNEIQGIHSDYSDDIEIVIYDGHTIPVDDGKFDLLVCNSVLEHVLPEERARLVDEMRRVAKRIFLQTPAYSFPLEPHFIMPFVHWLPRGLGFWLIHISPWRLLSRSTPEMLADYWWGTQLLTKSEIKSLFPNETIRYERVLGMTKSYYVISKNTG